VLSIFLLLNVLYVVLATNLPRALALAYSQKALLLTARFVWFLTIVLAPLASILDRLSKSLTKGTGVAFEESIKPFDVEVQMRALGQEQHVVSPQVRNIIKKTLLFQNRKVADVLLPRTQVQYLNVQQSVTENLERAKKNGHTRFPLCDGDLDQCFGLIHIKDVFRFRQPEDKIDFRKIRREIFTLKEDEFLEAVLGKFLRYKIHMALVVDEFGGVTGILTLEHIFEQLFGAIDDEFDIAEAQMILPLAGKRSYSVSGLAPIHDLESVLDTHFELQKEASTLNGLVTQKLGRMPKVGERVLLPKQGIEIIVDAVNPKQVVSTTVRVL
jgi:CBS domain containing-hemolysin-like protein